MKFKLGRPEHGWVHVLVEVNSDQFEFEASDVPLDPIVELINAIRTVAAGRSACVWWHLEPDGWYFELEPTGDMVIFRLLFAPDSDESKAELRAEVTESKSQILLPLWRGLREFESYAAVDPHWPDLEPGLVGALREKIENTSAGG